MKVYEVINFNRELLEKLGAAGIRLQDARYAGLYEDYDRMVRQGEKASYAVAVLAERYKVCERKAWDLIKRLGGDCKTPAV